MTQIFAGRFTAKTEDPFVVFLIGMRVNQWLAIAKWWPTFSAMRPMLQTLQQHPERGFLGGEPFLYARGVGLIQYWSSLDALTHFARNPGDLHQQAWQKFNRSIGADGSVGIWHETYQIAADKHESIYVNMPAFGLATATTHVPLSSRSS